MGERIVENHPGEPGYAIAYVYYTGNTRTKVIDGVEQEVETVEYLDSDFNELIGIYKNEIADAMLMSYRLDGVAVQSTPIAPDNPEDKSLESALWLRTPNYKKNKLRALLIQQTAREIIAEMSKSFEKSNPKKDYTNKLLLRY